MADDEHNKDLVKRATTDVTPSGEDIGVSGVFKRMELRQKIKTREMTAKWVETETAVTIAQTNYAQADKGLGEQLAENEAYDYDADVEKHKLRQKIDNLTAEDELAEFEHQMAVRAKQRARELEEKPISKTKFRHQKPDFAAEAEEILEFGDVGENMKKAEAVIREHMKKFGIADESHLPEDIQDHAKQLRRRAAELDRSKG